MALGEAWVLSIYIRRLRSVFRNGTAKEEIRSTKGYTGIFYITQDDPSSGSCIPYKWGIDTQYEYSFTIAQCAIQVRFKVEGEQLLSVSHVPSVRSGLVGRSSHDY